MLMCRVTGTLDGTECVYETPPIGSITVKNSPLWKSDPRQQLGYFAARSWARRHCPEVILGVYDRDEVQEIRDVTPPPSGLAARLKGEPQGGFNPAGVAEALRDREASPDASGGQETATAEKAVQSDPEMERAGAQAAIDGKAREAPEGLSPAEVEAWLVGYDAVRAGQEGGA